MGYIGVIYIYIYIGIRENRIETINHLGFRA